MEAVGGARSWALVVLLVVLVGLGSEAEAEEPRSARQRGDEQCHYYAGGQVYPGEAARVPVSDHSLHLSQAKSRCRGYRGSGCATPSFVADAGKRGCRHLGQSAFGPRRRRRRGGGPPARHPRRRGERGRRRGGRLPAPGPPRRGLVAGVPAETATPPNPFPSG